jgi:hypothetical protein
MVAAIGDFQLGEWLRINLATLALRNRSNPHRKPNFGGNFCSL